MSSLPFKNKKIVVAVQNYAEEAIKVFCSCSDLVDLFTLFQIFCSGLYFAGYFVTTDLTY